MQLPEGSRVIHILRPVRQDLGEDQIAQFDDRDADATACASKTYQRPQRSATGASAASSSTAAGCTGTTVPFGECDVEGEIDCACLGIRPAGIALEHLTPEIFCDAKPFERAQSRATSSRIPRVITEALYGRLL